MSQRLSSASEAQLGKVARGGAVNLVGAVVSSLAGFLLVVIVANNFSTEVAGTLFSIVSIFLILTATCSLGTDTGLGRFMLRFEAQGRYGDVIAGLRVAAWPVAAASCVAAVLVFFGADALAPLLGLDVEGGASMLRVAAVALPLATVSDFALACTRSFSRMRPTVLIDSILRVSIQVGAVFLVGVYDASREMLAAAWVGPYLISAILAVLVANQVVRTRRQGWPDHNHSEPGVVRREFWLYTWPRGIARICQIAIQRLDIVLIAALIGASKAAVYTAATRFVVLGQFAVLAIQQVLQPRFSQLIARDDLDTVRDVFKVSTAWCMSLSWPLYLTAAYAAPLYLQMFGSGYEDSGTAVVVIMAFAMMFSIAAGPLDTLLLMSGGSTASLLNTIVALTVSVVGCLVLIPRMGITGAAVAWGLAIVIRNTLTFFQVHRLLGLTPWSQGAGRVALASLVCSAAPLLIVRSLTDLTLLVFVPTVLVAGAAYFVALWLSRDQLALRALRALLQRRITG